MGTPAPSRWLFSPAADLAAFGGSAALSVALLAVGAHLGLLDGYKADTPEWTWVAAVLLIDVAHVWSTLFRVYLDPVEFRRRTKAHELNYESHLTAAGLAVDGRHLVVVTEGPAYLVRLPRGGSA